MGIEFLLASLLVIAIPGTGVLYTMAVGLAHGGRASVTAAFGCTLGIIPHMVAAIAGLAALLQASAVSFQILKYLGVAYLLYMAWKTRRDSAVLSVERDTATRSPARSIVSGVVVNLVNPKLTIFFVAFLPQFVSTDDPNPSWRMIELGAVFMLLTFVVFVAYGTLAAVIRNHVMARPRVLTWMRRFFAGGFVALAVALALTHE